ncbi:MAG: hypothetical protein JWO11_4490 [Nocardioides sp.]|nr:hypothetical protein [Nocardioides sp.]
MTERPLCEQREPHNPHVQPPGFAAVAEYCPGRSELTEGVRTRRARQRDAQALTDHLAGGAA